MSARDDRSLCLSLPQECCGFIDENEAFDVQFLDQGRLVCYSYGKEAFTTFWIVVDSFYGTKKIVITEVNKIDDWILLLSLDSYLIRTFDGAHNVQIIQTHGDDGLTSVKNLVEKTAGPVQRIALCGELLVVVLSIYENRFDELFKSTEIRLYKLNEWDKPLNVTKLQDEHFSYLDFVGRTSCGNLCFFASQGRVFHISDFATLIEVELERARATRWPTDGLSAIFDTNMEHLAKNTSGTWYNNHFYLYTTPNPTVVNLQHYFARLSVDTKQWQSLIVDAERFRDIVEVHMHVSDDGVMVLDCRNAYDERNIHRLPLKAPEPLLHLAQFAVNRRHGNLAEMSETQRQQQGFPVRLAIPPAFNYHNVTKHSLSTKMSKIVVSDALYG